MKFAHLKLWSTVAAVFVSLAGCSTAQQAGRLPEQTEQAYDAAIPAWVAEAKARPGSNPAGEKITAAKYLILTPIVFNWAPEGLQGRGFPPFWPQGDEAGGVQWMTNEISNYVMNGLEKRGIDAADAGSYKTDVPDIVNYGDSPTSVNGRSYDGGSISGYAYTAWKMKQWDMSDYGKISKVMPDFHSALFIQLQTTWRYSGHSKLNGEAMVNYEVYSVPIIKICSADGCREAKISAGNPLKSILPVPAEKAVDDEVRKKNNQFAVMNNAKYFGEMILAIFDNMAKAPAK